MVIKRDGRKVPFDKTKIEEAIYKAFRAVEGEISEYAVSKAKNIAAFIEEQAQNRDLDISEIQNYVENGLMATKKKDVARAYITYRNQRDIERKRKSKYTQIIKEKLMATNVQNQNANVDEKSFGGRAGEAMNEQNRQFALDFILSDMAKNNHLNNEIYIHDLDHYVLGDHNCLTLPIDDLLKNGCKVRQTDIRPAQSINTAFQLVAVLFQLQSLNMFGGVSASHLDWTMVPYVRKSFYKHYRDGLKYIENIEDWSIEKEQVELISIEDHKIYDKEKAYKYALDMTKKELNQSVEGMFHNLNTLQSRSGCQLPFSSINYGTCTLTEGRMTTKAILEGSIKGVGKFHRTCIFPCQIFQCMKGVNRKKGDPNYDLFQLALKSTAQRLYPNYCNVDWSINEGYDKNDPKTYVSTMGLVSILSSCKIF